MKIRYKIAYLLILIILYGCSAQDSTDSMERECVEYIEEVDDEKVYLQISHFEYDYCGFVTIKENILQIRPVEWIDWDDTERIAELGLTEQDIISGYHIYDTEQAPISFRITDKTEFHYIDWTVSQHGDERFVTTTDKDAFIDYMATYSDGAVNYPFFIIVESDCVKCVIEKHIA